MLLAAGFGLSTRRNTPSRILITVSSTTICPTQPNEMICHLRVEPLARLRSSKSDCRPRCAWSFLSIHPATINQMVDLDGENRRAGLEGNCWIDGSPHRFLSVNVAVQDTIPAHRDGGEAA